MKIITSDFAFGKSSSDRLKFIREMKLTEEMVGQIHDPEKLRFLLIRMIQKKASQSKKDAIRKKQIRDLRTKFKTNVEELKKLRKIVDETNVHQFDSTIERLRGDFNEFFFTQIFQLIQGIDSININEQIQPFQERLEKIEKAQIEHFESVINEKNQLIEDMSKKIDDLTDQLNIAQSSPISKDIEKIISEKDSTIIKLKSMLQSAVKSDQMKQQLVEEQQKEIQRLSDALTHRHSASGASGSFVSSSSIDEVARLEMTISDLEDRINNSAASKELEARNEKLTSMIEKSNALYAQANETIIKLNQRLKKDSNKLKVNDSLLFEMYYLKNSSQKRKKKSSKIKKIKRSYQIVFASLRKTLLQFFLKEPKDQVFLIPVILELVGCNEEQVNTVLLKTKSNNQIINLTDGFFGIFGR